VVGRDMEEGVGEEQHNDEDPVRFSVGVGGWSGGWGGDIDGQASAATAGQGGRGGQESAVRRLAALAQQGLEAVPAEGAVLWWVGTLQGVCVWGGGEGGECSNTRSVGLKACCM
jgi:hypothetical protein